MGTFKSENKRNWSYAYTKDANWDKPNSGIVDKIQINTKPMHESDDLGGTQIEKERERERESDPCGD